MSAFGEIQPVEQPLREDGLVRSSCGAGLTIFTAAEEDGGLKKNAIQLFGL